MADFKLTKKAVEDLKDIWNYTFDQWSERQADKYYKSLLEGCKEIANNPKIGKNYHDVTDDLFGYKTNRHIIFYRVLIDKPIEITRILHGRMDLQNRLNE